MKTLEAPSTDKSYIAIDERYKKKEIDEEGLPLVYDKDLIEAYWSKERGALNKRWGYFVGKAVPFLTKLTTLFIRDGKIIDEEIPALSKQARMDLQDLGPVRTHTCVFARNECSVCDSNGVASTFGETHIACKILIFGIHFL
jgi:hypothetical protein